MPNMLYDVTVGDKAGHALLQTFTHPAPEWLFDEGVDNVPAYLKILSDKSHPGILQATSWHCWGCDKPATQLVSRPLCFVHKGIIGNFLVPVCQSEECEHVAVMHHNESEKSIDAMIYSKSGGSSNLADGMRRPSSIDPHGQRCGNCKIVAPVKACKGCRQVAYCGRECQKLDWKRHKLQCRPAAGV